MSKARKRQRYRTGQPVAISEAAQEEGKALVAGRLTGIVAEVQRFRCVVLHNDEPIESDYRRVKIPPDIGAIVVGDFVSFDLQDGQGIIRTVLPRRSKLVRARGDTTRPQIVEEHVLAANVDWGVIVASAVMPPFHPRLIDRYLVICQYGGVQPLICINKCDLVSNLPDLSIYQLLGIPIIHISALTGLGFDDLRSWLRGKLSVFIGHSGVGKSSIINRLLGEARLRVREVRSSDGRGRHTTTVSTLHRIDAGSYVVDTPGIRNLGLWGIDPSELRLYFPEFRKFRCHFRNCTHVREPGCGVRAAVDAGYIPQARYDAYIRLLQE